MKWQERSLTSGSSWWKCSDLYRQLVPLIYINSRKKCLVFYGTISISKKTGQEGHDYTVLRDLPLVLYEAGGIFLAPLAQSGSASSVGQSGGLISRVS